jgi:hypothetical protein
VERDPEVDASMRLGARSAALLATALLLAATLLVLPAAAPSARASTAAAAHPVTGNLTGPTLLGWKANAQFVLHATGGPAVLPNGSIVGNLTYYASLSGTNVTGASITPDSSGIVNGGNNTLTFTANNVTQTIDIVIEIASVLNSSNESYNFTYAVQIVQPYVVATTLVNFGNTTVLTFPVQVWLDGAKVATVPVPTILAHQTYAFSYAYASLNLPAGQHTFTLVLGDQHGLVRFPNGSIIYTQTFYIPAAPPNYTDWYAAGVIAFLGALLIFGARVGARRRGAAKK